MIIFVVYGERTYGKVDRVPGECYVTTVFFHLFFLPVAPLRSYIVVEGSEDERGFRGREIPLSGKSAIAGYFRVYSGIVAVLCGLFGVLGLMAVAKQLHMNLLAPISLGVVGVGGLAMLFLSGRTGAIVQLAVHSLSGILWYIFKDVIEQNAEVLGGADVLLVSLVLMNLALFVYGLTYFFDFAGSRRSRELVDQLGMDSAVASCGLND